MRSCEYSKSDKEDPQTKLLTLDNVKFYDKNGNELKSKRHLAHYVKFIFRNQRKWNHSIVYGVTQTLNYAQ